VTCFTNSNSTLDLLAPGAPITSAGRNGGRSTFFGTSQASPHAAGAAAVLLEVDPTLTPDQIETLLKTTGVKVTDAKNGLTFPRIDLLAAVNMVRQ
jgi:subtilisin family serine protease